MGGPAGSALHIDVPAGALSSGFPAELAALLLCARAELDPAQTAALDRLIERGLDWPALAHWSVLHRMSALAHRHLCEGERKKLLPAGARAVLGAAHRGQVQRMLAVTSVLREIVRDVLEPLSVPYVVVKGVPLAERYYGGVGLRPSRDVDILVPDGRRLEVLHALAHRGYRRLAVVSGAEEGPEEGVAIDPRMEAASRFNAPVAIVSPNGTVVDVHRLLDHVGHLFRTEELLEKAERMDVQGLSCRVLPTNELFVYLAYHHTRHKWTRMHWVADLDFLPRSPDFELAEVMRAARRRGLATTVEGALALGRALASPDPARAEVRDRRFAAMRDVALWHLALPEEERVRVPRPVEDIAFPWQVEGFAPRLRYELLRLRTLKPTYTDYKAFPLPRNLTWLYYLSRPLRSAWARATARGRAVRDGR